jgi:hypothetical protein
MRKGLRTGPVRFFTLPLAAALTLAAASPAGAEEVVNDNTDGPGACATPNHATVQAGVNAASADETVTVCPGTYAETVTIPNGSDGLTIDGATGQPTITGGLGYGTPTTDLTLRDIHVQPGAGVAVIGSTGSVTNLTMDNVRVDGDDVAGKHGVASGQIHGAVSVQNSQFVDIRNWAVFDTRSGSGGATSGSLLTTFNFSNNLLSNNAGHVNARGTIGSETDQVTIANNTVLNYPATPANNAAAVFKAFYADDLDFTDNEITDVGSLQTSIGGFPYGAGLMPRNVGSLTVTGNTFEDAVQGIAFEPRNTTSGGFPDGVVAGGTIADNLFLGNTQGIFVTATNHPNSNLGALQINRNRFFGNTEAVDNNSAASLSAENSWWGCNAGPGNAGCDAVSGTVDSDPRLVLGLSASPTSIATGGVTSTVTADLGKNSAGQGVTHDLFDGDAATFGTSLGSIQSPRTIAGTLATSTLTSGGTAGTANVTATVDGQSSATQVTFNAPATGGDTGGGDTGGTGDTGGQQQQDGGATEVADDLVGTDLDDEIAGLDGADSILGGLGDDLLSGNSGADEIDGGGGDDVIHGGRGPDVLDGGDGNDEVSGGRGQDQITADDDEKDVINCGANVDDVNADDKDDVGSNCENVS